MFKSTALPEVRAVRSAHRGRRRLEQRVHQCRCDRLHRPGAVEPPRGAAVGRGRAHVEPERGAGELRVRACRRRGGIPGERAGGALRPLHERDRAGCLPGPPLQAPDHRQHRGPRAGDAARRRCLPRRPLPPGQRHAGGRRRLRSAAARCLGRQVLRTRAAAGHATAPRGCGRAGLARRPQRHRHRTESAVAGGRAGLARAAGDQPPTRLRCGSPRRCWAAASRRA